MKSENNDPPLTITPMSTWLFMVSQAKIRWQEGRRTETGWESLVREFEIICERLKLLLLAVSCTQDDLDLPQSLIQALNLDKDRMNQAKGQADWPEEVANDKDWLLSSGKNGADQSLILELDLDDQDGICWDDNLDEEKHDIAQTTNEIAAVENSSQSVVEASDKEDLFSDLAQHLEDCSRPNSAEAKVQGTMIDMEPKQFQIESSIGPNLRRCRTRNNTSRVLPARELRRFIVRIQDSKNTSGSERTKLKCVRCGITRKAKATMVAHVRTCLMTCSFCQKIFQNETQDWLRKHEMSCQQPSIKNVSPNKIETTTSAQQDRLESDLSLSSSSSLKPKRCCVCDRLFSSSKSLASFLGHQSRCQSKSMLAPFFNPDKGLYECVCTHTGLRPGYFNRHVKACIQLPKCSKCERRFHHLTPETDVQEHEMSCVNPCDETRENNGPDFLSQMKPMNEGASKAQSLICKKKTTDSIHKEECQYCGKQVGDRQHHEPECKEAQLCRFCDRRFPKKFKNFERHETRCQRILANKGIIPPHQILDNEYLCTFPACTNNQNSFQTYEMLQVHFTREHIETHDLPHKCTICDERFISRAFMTRHRFRHKERYTCDTCGKGFVERMALSRHIVSHSSEKGHVCPKDGCNYKANLKDTLNRHLRKIHNEMLGASHFCEKCGRSFLSRPALELHREKVHINPKPRKLHQCPRCDFKTTKTSMLRQHIDYRCQFDGTNKCVCETCGKALKTKESLRDHVKTVHLKIFSPGQIRKREKARRIYQEAKVAHD